MEPRLSALRLARLHGTFNVLTGAWPLVSMRSFEAVSGRKADRWLVRTVAGLMIAGGIGQLRAEGRQGLRVARDVGLGTAVTFLLIDLVYGSTGRISRVYLGDAALESAWLLAWLTAEVPAATRFRRGQR